MFKSKEKPTFWVTNIAKKAVSLMDLNISIQPNRSINLLDKKRYPHLTYDQIIQSSIDGSLFKKSNLVAVRKVPPGTPLRQYIPLQENAIFLDKSRSAIKIEEIHYEELDISDDQYAAENADTAEQDHVGHWATKNK
jgi:hypothetical protein